MNVQPIDTQAHDPAIAGSTQGDRQGAGPAAQPAIYDTSATQGQDQASPPSGNVGTTWKFDDRGKPVLAGYFRAPAPAPSGNGHVDTPWDVFRRGFTDGATHPGQTVGKMADIAKGETAHDGEETGKKADSVLENVPVIGDALAFTRGLAGEKNPDGTPVLAVPNVQPDERDAVSSRQARRLGALLPARLRRRTPARRLPRRELLTHCRPRLRAPRISTFPRNTPASREAAWKPIRTIQVSSATIRARPASSQASSVTRSDTTKTMARGAFMSRISRRSTSIPSDVTRAATGRCITTSASRAAAVVLMAQAWTRSSKPTSGSTCRCGTWIWSINDSIWKTRYVSFPALNTRTGQGWNSRIWTTRCVPVSLT